MKLYRTLWLGLPLAALLCAGSPWARAQGAAKIPGAEAKPGATSHESTMDGALEKYDSTLNKVILKGDDGENVTLDAERSLRAKVGGMRVPMATVKQGQKIRVFYVEKAGKKIVKDVEVVKEETESEAAGKKQKTEKDEKKGAAIPGSD